YWRDALIATVGSALLGMMAVWFVEFFKRSGVTPPEPVASQPIIQIAYPPNIMLNQGAPALELPAQRVPETLAAPAARELSALEVGALWSAAVPDTRVIIAGLLNGLSPAELSALRYQDIDLGAQCLHLAGSS